MIELSRAVMKGNETEALGRRSIRVETGVPLMRAGLERAAEASGFELIDRDDAEAWLVGPDQTKADHGIVIIAGERSTTVRISEVPDEEIWGQIRVLLRNLLSPSSDTPLADGLGLM